MDNNILQEIKNRAEKIDGIRGLLSINFRGQGLPVDEGIRCFELVVITEAVDDKDLIISLFIDDDKLLIYKQYEEVREGHVAKCIRASFTDFSQLTLKLIDVKDMEKFVPYLAQFDILIDKTKAIKKLPKVKDRYDWYVPKAKEFYNNCLGFFMTLTDIATAVTNRQIVKANFLFDELKKELLNVANLYIGQKYGEMVAVNSLGDNIKTYLDKDMYQEFEGIFSTGKVDEFWTSIFKAGQLYRRLGLEVSEKFAYKYPKKEDVETMNFLRQVYVMKQGGSR